MPCGGRCRMMSATRRFPALRWLMPLSATLLLLVMLRYIVSTACDVTTFGGGVRRALVGGPPEVGGQAMDLFDDDSDGEIPHEVLQSDNLPQPLLQSDNLPQPQLQSDNLPQPQLQSDNLPKPQVLPSSAADGSPDVVEEAISPPAPSVQNEAPLLFAPESGLPDCERRANRSYCTLVAQMTASLRDKLALVKDPKHYHNVFPSDPLNPADFKQSCKDLKYVNYDDSNKNVQKTIPESLEQRVETFLNLPKIPQDVINLMGRYVDQVPGKHEFMVLSGASDNHMGEIKTLIGHLQKGIFTVLKSYKFVIYDLGLNDRNRASLESMCKCQVLRFPFKQLPAHFKDMKCFAWKMFIIATHFQQAENVMWMDTSIRIINKTAIFTLIDRSKERGVQVRRGGYPRYINNKYTRTSMFEWFGHSACSNGYQIEQSGGGFGIFHNEPFTWHMVVFPWLTCAYHKECMCPLSFNEIGNCPPDHKKDNLGGYLNKISLCHRQDQSAISVILAWVFREMYTEFSVDMRFFEEIQGAAVPQWPPGQPIPKPKGA